MKPTALLLLFLLLSASSLCVADTPPRYTLTVLPLDFSGFNELYPEAAQGGINTHGQIVGTASIQSGKLWDNRIALWQHGRPLRILDKRPITDVNATAGQDYLYATAINAHGKATGIRQVSSSGAYSINISTGYVLWNGCLRDLSRDTPTNAEMATVALGLSDQGEVVGSFRFDNTTADQISSTAPPGTENRHAFLWSGGHMISLWAGVALGINSHKWIVGVQDFDDDDSHARGVLWRNGHSTLFKMQPVAVSDAGEVAGNLPLTDETGEACVWRQGRITVLSKKISHAEALNNRGQVVGSIKRATLWQNGRTYDLNRCVALPKGWVLENAVGINDSGWIIGEGSVYKTPKDTQAVKSFTFLLTPL